MASRPPAGGPEPGSPEYDWLYGDHRAGSGDPEPTRAVRRPPAEPPGAEPTQVLPTGPPPRSAAPPPAPPPRRTIAPPPDQPSSPSSRTKRRRRLGPIKLLVLLWLVFMIAVPIIAWTRIDKVSTDPGGDRPAEQDGTTYLIVGSDSRKDLTAEERKELGTGNAQSELTDTIMLLHTGSGPNLLMSIPRDSQVEIPGHGVSKINAAVAYGGRDLLVQTIEANTGIRVDHYVEIGMGGFVGVVDAVGGIEICPDEAMEDPDANLDIKAGCQEADGVTALGYARSRKTSALGDIDRARRQREVVSAVGSEALSPWSILNPVRYYRLNMAMPGFFKVSEGTQPWHMASFAFAMTRVDGDSGLTCGVPIADMVVNWDAERSEELFSYIRDDNTAGIPDGLCTPTGMVG